MLNRIEKFVPGAIILGISSLLSRVLGLVRDRILANQFGASQGSGIYDIDTYYAAFRIPDFLFAILIVGAVSTAFIPIFGRYIQKNDKKEAWEFANNCLNIITIGMIIMALVAFIFAPQIVKILAPGFSQQKLAVTAQVTRLMLISPLFFGLSSIAQSIQNSFKKFFYYALAPILYNLSIILAAYFFSAQYGVYAAAIGVIIGAFLHFLIQIPAILKLGFRWQPVLDFKRQDFREMVKLLIPRVLSISSLQINLVIETLIASTLATGSVAILNYAFNLNSLPMGIIGISIAIVSFATFTDLAGQGDHAALILAARKNLSNILFLIIPSIIGLIVLRNEIVQIILGVGKFSLQDIHLTANTLGFFSLGLIGQATIPMLARIFYAYKDTKTPMKITTGIVIINIIISVTMVFGFKYGIYGIAMGGSSAQILGFIIFIIALNNKRDIKGILEIKRLFKFITIGILMGYLVYIIKKTIGTLLLGTISSAIIGALFYLGLAHLTQAGSLKIQKANQDLPD